MHYPNDPFLHVQVEQGLHHELPLGRGNALFLKGWCFHRRLPLRGLALRIGDRHEQRIRTHSMPRPEVVRSYGAEIDPLRHSYRSGFWSVIPLSPELAGKQGLELVATLANGDSSSRRLGEIALRPPAAKEGARFPSGAASTDRGLIAVCMATRNPPPELLHLQLESLRAQTHTDWLCVISDDSEPQHYERVKDSVGEDERFRLVGSDRRLGRYHSFERALSLVPSEAPLVALCDQADRWYPEKLERLRDALDSEASLVYGDMRVVDPLGREISDTFWSHRRTNHRNLMSAMLAATMTPTSSLFPRALLDSALPFPLGWAGASPERWLGMLALATGRVEYIPEPVQDYVHYDGRSDEPRTTRWPPRKPPRIRPTPHAARQTLVRWSRDYFRHALALQLCAAVLLLRAGESLRGRKRRTARILRASERLFPALLLISWLWLRARGARLRRASTMGTERAVVTGLLWRRLAGLIGRVRRRRNVRDG